MQIDHINLYYQQIVDTNVPIEAVADTMKTLVKEGKILARKLSKTVADTIRCAHNEFPVTAIQSEYSMWYHDRENDIIAVLEELGIGFVPFNPLVRDFSHKQLKSIQNLRIIIFVILFQNSKGKSGYCRYCLQVCRRTLNSIGTSCTCADFKTKGLVVCADFENKNNITLTGKYECGIC